MAATPLQADLWRTPESGTRHGLRVLETRQEPDGAAESTVPPGSPGGSDPRQRNVRRSRRAWRPHKQRSASFIRRQLEQVLDRSKHRERFWLQAELEIEKARRHNRRFVLALMSFEPDADSPDRIETALALGLRFEDGVLVDDRQPGEVLVILSEIDAPAANRVLGRLEIQHARLGLRRASVAEFPTHALTLRAMVDELVLRASSPENATDAPLALAL